LEKRNRNPKAFQRTERPFLFVELREFFFGEEGTRAKWLLIRGDLCYYKKQLYLVEKGHKDAKYCDLTVTGGRR
jgi:hypothetical protein